MTDAGETKNEDNDVVKDTIGTIFKYIKFTFNWDHLWDLMYEADKIVPWKYKFPGNPNFKDAYEFIQVDLKEKDLMLYTVIRKQYDYNVRYALSRVKR